MPTNIYSISVIFIDIMRMFYLAVYKIKYDLFIIIYGACYKV